MKYFLMALVLGLTLQLKADEESAKSARSSENSPGSQRNSGEGIVSGTTGKVKTDDMVLRDHKLDSVCQAEGNPDDCFDKTTAKMKKKKAAMKKKVLTPNAQ